MLPPHELKNKTFTRAMRGYNTVEVDEYIEFLIGKYTELYRENDELERKLKSTVTKLDEIKGEEDSIRSALIDAKRAASKIKSDAEERAEAIIRSAKSSCNAILSDFNDKIESGRATLLALKSDTVALKEELFERYSEHIKYIDTLTDGVDLSDLPDTDSIRREAVSSLKQSIAEAYAPAPETEEEESAETAEEEITLQPEPEPEIMSEEEVELELEPEAEDGLDETITFTPTHIEDTPRFADDAVSDETSLTTTFDKFDDVAEEDAEVAEEIDTSSLNVEREPLSKSSGKGKISDSIKELNKRYKEEDDVINTPDSDLDDDANYLDFVKSVTGKDKKNDKKQADFDLLFNDTKKKK